MSMLGRLRRARDRAATRLPALQPDHETERYAFAGELPGHGGLTACRVSIELLREPHQDGQRLRVSAHLQANLASAVRPTLRARTTAGADTARLSGPVRPAARTLVARTAGRLVQHTLSRSWVQRLTEPLLRFDLNTWVHIQASTAALDAGSRALLPESSALTALGIRPGSTGEGLQAEVWTHGDARQKAELSILRIDKQDLPKGMQEQLGDQPFQLVATVGSTLERG